MREKVQVKRWNDPPLQGGAASTCTYEGCVGFVGIAIHAMDGNLFAHAPLTIDGAKEFLSELHEAIVAAEKKARH